MAASSARARRALRRNAVQAAEREEVRALAVGYLRVSTDEQAQRGNSLPEQEQAIRAYATAVGLDLVHVLSDPGVSGTVKPAERPGFSQVLQLAADRRFSVLLVKRFDRLARNIALAVTTSAVTSNSVPVVDPVYGHKVISNQGSDAGNRLFTLVGMVCTDNSAQFRDEPGVRYVASYFNRRRRPFGSSVSNGSTSSTSAVLIGGSCYFLSWGDEDVRLDLAGYMLNNTAFGYTQAYPFIDGATTGSQAAGTSAAAGALVNAAAVSCGNVSEGNHSAALYGSVNTGTGSFYVSLVGEVTI